VKSYPVQRFLPCYYLDIGTRFVQQRRRLKGALPSADYNYALPSKPT
jgi:hypothetical protein